MPASPAARLSTRLLPKQTQGQGGGERPANQGGVQPGQAAGDAALRPVAADQPGPKVGEGAAEHLRRQRQGQSQPGSERISAGEARHRARQAGGAQQAAGQHHQQGARRRRMKRREPGPPPLPCRRMEQQSRADQAGREQEGPSKRPERPGFDGAGLSQWNQSRLLPAPWSS
jgi:hypothetical protein